MAVAVQEMNHPGNPGHGLVEPPGVVAEDAGRRSLRWMLHVSPNNSRVILTTVQIGRTFLHMATTTRYLEAQVARDLERKIDRALRYLKMRFPAADAFRIAMSGRRDYMTPEGIRSMPAVEFLRTLI